ncbi:MAG: DNA repair protein [Fluviicola sp. XM-24bin1]|nr:MAG: DNA repair protein [Fluviicola sp. XM-24bin1]
MERNTQNLQVKEIELSYRQDKAVYKGLKISSSEDAFNYFNQSFNQKLLSIQEQFLVIFLNRSNKPIGVLKLSTGGINSTVADIRLIMATALKSLSSAIIIAHNHPSGELKPSQSDIQLTKQIKDACKFFDLQLLDHLILNPVGEYSSFADEGIL